MGQEDVPTVSSLSLEYCEVKHYDSVLEMLDLMTMSRDEEEEVEIRSDEGYLYYLAKTLVVSSHGQAGFPTLLTWPALELS